MDAITVLGSTGSIGKSTLDVVAQHPDRYRVFALTANTNVDALLEQVIQFKPDYAVMVDAESATQLSEKLKNQTASLDTKVLSGADAVVDISKDPESSVVMASIVGAAGLLPTLAAIQTGKKVLLANKEALVMSGAYFMQQAELHKATLLPVDSEHNAIFQCLPLPNADKSYQGLTHITLTASGGPFRLKSQQELQNVTPAEACAHPNWDMGKKISVDSASLMNKGLEIIEAHWLFSMPHDKIDVVVHPESIIHSMVSYQDGSVLAQMGNPDMRTPIAHAMAWPERIESSVKPLNLAEVAQLNFEKPDLKRFPCLQLAYDAINLGGEACIRLNAANEQAVDAFLNNKIRFVDIPVIIANNLEQTSSLPVSSLEEIMFIDQQARQSAEQFIKKELLKNHA